MRILFAAPDRDLLECYAKLLAADLGETVTAFDGTQVLFLVESESFDMVVIDSALPRIEPGSLVKSLKSRGIPVVALMNDPAEDIPADAFLTYPFDEDDLVTVIKNTIANNGFEPEMER